MTRWRELLPRLAGPLSRQPLRIAIVAVVVGALGLTGLVRFGVDSGQSLLVGSSSSAGQTYASFARTFGSDPIVAVFTARNPTAPYIERNLERLGALEIDLAHDQRVASVVGPGTIAGSLREAAVAEVTKVLTEYPYFIGETDELQQLQMGNNNQQQLQQRFQSDVSNATTLLELYVVRAASDAHNARAQYVAKQGDRFLDSREKAVDSSLANEQLPPLWAEYLAGPGQQTNPAAAQRFFAQVAAAYGDCDNRIASLLKISPSCQVFFERTLLDLPNCPPTTSHLFCNPKPQWAAVLPAPLPGGESYEILTVRLKPQYVGDESAVSSLQDKINSLLAHGIGSDSYTQALSAASRNTLKSLGPLAPTECGGATSQQDPACNTAFHDAHLAYVTAGAPLLGLGVVQSMKTELLILLPFVVIVMALLLVGVFRVRGRLWPLLAAGVATVLTIGIALLTGTPITPAVLAGVPVLVGLGVDYAVQLVARYSEERARGSGIDEALQHVLSNTAPATLVAALATVVGLAALALVGGVDWGPLAAVPLVAEFALVLCGGVILAWLGGLFIALSLAVWSDKRTPAGAADRSPAVLRDRGEPSPAAARTTAIADNWRGVVALTSLLALAGWVLLRVVPVQTDVQQLVPQSLTALANINTVQAETGYTNEIDVYLRGRVATGPVDSRTSIPTSIEWQCGVASLIRTTHRDTVAQATSIGDYVIASGTGSGSSTAAQCVPSAPAQGSPSPAASPSPSASASPSSVRSRKNGVVTASRVIAAEAAATPSPSPSASPRPSPSPSASPAPSGGSAPTTQTRFLCDLRLLPPLSRTLVMDIGLETQACPPVDEYQHVFLSTDGTPINPNASRIAVGVHTASVADQAKLVNSLRSDISNPPNGLSAAPTGLAVLATTAYDNLVSRAYLLNLLPLVIVAAALYAIYREPRRALLPILPTALAAGWAPLLLLILGRLPGGVGSTLGSFNPLTVVLGALIVALGTEFGVVLLGRFYEERARGLDPDAAAGAALDGVGRAIRVSALTLGAGFAVLAVSGLFPNSLPLVADFGLAVVIDLGLAVAAVFLVMLPVAVALERYQPLRLAAAAPAAVAPTRAPVAEPPTPPRPAKPDAPVLEAPAAPRRAPGVSGRRRAPRAEPEPVVEPTPDVLPTPRRPGVSGRKRRR